MVGTAAQVKYFQPEETAPDGDWHSFREDGANALCQQTSLRYNVDRIADAVPSGGHLCDGCNAVLSGVEPVTEAIVDEPVGGPADVTMGEAGPETVATPEPVEGQLPHHDFPAFDAAAIEPTEPVNADAETGADTDTPETLAETLTEATSPEDQAPAG